MHSITKFGMIHVLLTSELSLGLVITKKFHFQILKLEPLAFGLTFSMVFEMRSDFAEG